MVKALWTCSDMVLFSNCQNCLKLKEGTVLSVDLLHVLQHVKIEENWAIPIGSGRAFTMHIKRQRLACSSSAHLEGV